MRIGLRYEVLRFRLALPLFTLSDMRHLANAGQLHFALQVLAAMPYFLS